MTATAIVTLLGEPEYSEFIGWHQGVKVACPECDYVTFTGGAIARDWSTIIDDHLEQHKPGRALDLEIEYVLHASCTVCDDGGDVQHDSTEVVKCQDCGTSWYEDGTGGERAESEGDE